MPWVQVLLRNADTLNTMLKPDVPSVIPDDREIDEYWERYAELSTREQIREGGISWWLCNTNKGVLVHLSLWAIAIALAGWLLS